MFIVIEGTDASGKSSLVEEIVRQVKQKYPNSRLAEAHKGKPEELTRLWTLREYAISLEREDFQSLNMVSDRWHWGEITYAPHKRPQTNIDGFGLLGVAGWRWVEMFLASRGVAQYWLYQPLEVLKRRLASRGDDFVREDELETILNLYKKAADSTHTPTRQVLPKDDISDIPSIASALISDALAVSAAAAHVSEFPEYIGSPKPKALLIGDRRNIPPENTILPFMPINGNSGEYLLTAMPDDLWREVGIVNAGDVYGLRLLKLHSLLGCPPVVALGRMAEREVRSSGLHTSEHTVVPHPQYVRRFHYQDREEYGRAIRAFSTGTEDDRERFKHWILP